MSADRGLIANRSFAGQRVRGTYFFAGNWRFAPPGEPVHQWYEYPLGPNDQWYTVHPSDARHLGWSESDANKAFALDAMVSAGVNTVVMSYWGERGTDRWAWWAPMQTSTFAHDELFSAVAGKPLLIMPAIESGGYTQPAGNSQSYNFSQDFPGTATNPAPALVTQVLDLVSRYLQNPSQPDWAARWLQLVDRNGVARYAINLLHVASSQISGDADEIFAAGYQWVADRVYALTGLLVGFTLDALPKGQNIYQPVWDRGGWVPWFTIHGETLAYPGAPITALWANNDHLDLFSVSSQGTVMSTFWDQDGGYSAEGWFDIHPEMHFDRPAQVTAVWANDSHLDLFAVNSDGFVASIWWEAGGYRNDGWFLVDPRTHFQPGTPVTVLWANSDHLDIFAIDDAGSVRTIWWDRNEASGFNPDGWLIIRPETRSMAGGYVTAVWANQDHLDLFVVTADQAVSSIWWQKEEGYRAEGWFGIGSERTFEPGAKVAALWAPGEGVQHLDLFTTDSAGEVRSIWFDTGAGGYRPEGWFTIPGPGVAFTQGAYIACSWISSQELLLVACDSTGTVRGANWTQDTGWTAWFLIGPEFRSIPGGTITALPSPDPNHVDVFAPDGNGLIKSTYYRFNVNDTYVATGSRSGSFLEKTSAVLAIQAFIPEVFSSGGDIDRFEAKQSYWEDWLGSGVPVFWDVSPGYDAHLVFPNSDSYGNDSSWRIYIRESWDQRFKGMVYNTWNGYTEGYAAMPSLEYGDLVSNWARQLFDLAR